MTRRCASVFKTCSTPYYSRCRVERPDHGVVHMDKQGRAWLGEWESDYAMSDAIRLPFFFCVTTSAKGNVTWKVRDVASGRVIARSPGRYATIDEAHADMRAFQDTMRG